MAIQNVKLLESIEILDGVLLVVELFTGVDECYYLVNLKLTETDEELGLGDLQSAIDELQTIGRNAVNEWLEADNER